ncbi:MAG: transporter substrate-binding domain-containing protein [Methylacidiphilales bacterium]|nr:transporter substrate-binding domain-containing protein [Candidatus Methylacidiphilales bacterium]
MRRMRVTGLCAAALVMAALLAAPAAPAMAPDDGVRVPSFWDPKRRPEKPDLGRLALIRFLTEEDYPPFNFKGADGNPTGFNVDLARAICEELKVACTVQMRRFDTLLDALNENRGDAVIASLAITPQTRARADFTDRYYRSPARFVAHSDFDIKDIRPESITGRAVAVVAGTAHEAYLRAFFAETSLRTFPTLDAAKEALKARQVDLLFGDGIALAFWLNGSGSANCCAFRGGFFHESRYFGEGVGIAVRTGNETLRRAFDWALHKLWEKGVYTDLYLRYFPIGFF